VLFFQEKLTEGRKMLASSKIIGFVPTKDSVKARGFYEGILQFEFVSDDMFALVMKAGETMLRIGKAQDFTPAPYTVLGWEVSNIEEIVRWLQKRGSPWKSFPSSRIKSWESGLRPTATKLRGSETPTEMCFL
jgi:hypothetical protein